MIAYLKSVLFNSSLKESYTTAKFPLFANWQNSCNSKLEWIRISSVALYWKSIDLPFSPYLQISQLTHMTTDLTREPHQLISSVWAHSIDKISSMEASLVENFILAKFQLEIRKYGFAENLGSCREK
jgi:hypothetical protein